jgi:hypothetical protein
MITATGNRATALEETMAHSVLKHDLLDTITFEEQPTQVVDLYGGAILYQEKSDIEIGVAGRVVMNGYTPDYWVNDILYQGPSGGTCAARGLPDQQQPVLVHVTNQRFDYDPVAASRDHGLAIALGKTINIYLARIPPAPQGKRLVFVDPYYMVYQETANALLEGNPATEFVFYSPNNRAENYPLPPACQTFVFSEADTSWKILTNGSSKNPLTYSVSGCRLTKMPQAIQKTTVTFGKAIHVQGWNALIQTTQKPLDFHKYLTGAQTIRNCVVEGKGRQPPADK